MHMNTHSMKRLGSELEWETFASHCFRCGEWGHFIVECQHHCPSMFIMKELIRKELREILECPLLWLLWMKEHLLEMVIKRPHFKVWALRIRELNLWVRKIKV